VEGTGDRRRKGKGKEKVGRGREGGKERGRKGSGPPHLSAEHSCTAGPMHY